MLCASYRILSLWDLKSYIKEVLCVVFSISMLFYVSVSVMEGFRIKLAVSVSVVEGFRVNLAVLYCYKQYEYGAE